LSQNNPIPADITTSWLTKLLGRTITHVAAKAVGTGQVGATFRFSLTADDTDVPTTLIGKFMSEDPVSRATGIAQLSYVREVNFYRHFGNAKALPVPRLHYVSLNETTHEFALIMEDFPQHTCGNQLEPASLRQAELAMDAAAQIHAAFWNHEPLDTHMWLNGSKAITPMNVDGLYSMLWPAFCDRYRSRISNEVVTVGDAYVGRINDWIATRTGPRCLTHGDFRPDNMLFAPNDPRKPLVIVDWQTAGVGNGATDIAYYLGTAMTPNMRRMHERALVDRWIAGLMTAGVAPSDTRDLWETYRRDAVSGFLMGVLASMIVAQTERGDAMFLEMCARAAIMVEDHKAASLV
jgi:Phosphotransferase enzyme family